MTLFIGAITPHIPSYNVVQNSVGDSPSIDFFRGTATTKLHNDIKGERFYSTKYRYEIFDVFDSVQMSPYYDFVWCSTHPQVMYEYANKEHVNALYVDINTREAVNILSKIKDYSICDMLGLEHNKENAIKAIEYTKNKYAFEPKVNARDLRRYLDDVTTNVK